MSYTETTPPEGDSGQRLDSLLPRVLRFIKQHDLVRSGKTLLVAVSGGPDSVCLLHILVGLQAELGVKLHVAHLDHQLRGADSEADARYVANLAARLGTPVTLARHDVKAYRVAHRLSLEEAAREVRYGFLAEVAHSLNIERVAVGHTCDDHIETILMHVIRGTGTRGLRGLLPVTRWHSDSSEITVVRPLLEVSREETDAYCQRQGLAPRLDVSNLALSPFRNRVRLQLLPQLKSYNPRIVEALLRTARIATDEFVFFEQETDRVWGEVARRENDILVLDKEKLSPLHSALKRHILQKAIEEMLGTLKDIETRHIEDMMSALAKPAGTLVTLPRGILFVVEYDRYLVGRNPAALCPFTVLEGETRLNIPGETRIPGWRVEATITDHAGYETHEGLVDSMTACFDLSKTGRKLYLRSRQPGDRFQPLGMGQPKLLADFMVDARIPRAWRDRVPIVVSPSQITWVTGWRIDDRVKVTPRTDEVLCLTFERVAGGAHGLFSDLA